MPINRTLANYIASNPTSASASRASGVWTLDEQGSALAQNNWPAPPSVVQRSLRFNSADTAYLNRTLGTATNQKIWTWSSWIKIGVVDSNYRVLVEGFTGGNDVYNSIALSSNALQINQDNGSGGVMGIVTSAVFRDLSAWYHIVCAIDTTQATGANGVKFYVNGVQQTVTVSAYVQNLNTWINSANSHRIGGRWNLSATGLFNGYMTEINFVDGQQLTPSSFGETDPQTGVWVPKPYAGTYGTNGFRLNFSNNSSTAALGYDSSGNGNNWTVNNFSVTAGSGNDSMLDVPSLYGTDTGLGGEVRGNYATFNSLSNPGNSTLTNGNLDVTTPNTTAGRVLSTIAPSSGKWYCEFTVTNVGAGFRTGVVLNSFNNGDIIGNFANEYAYYSDGNKYSNNVAASYGASYTTNDIISVALDLDSGTISFYKNGINQGVAYTGLSGSFAFGVCDITGASGISATANFGQRPWAYTPPTGYKALCTTNLSGPAIGQASGNRANNYFDVVTYTGNGSTQSISTLAFQPDLIWIKRSDGSGQDHVIMDSVRGFTSATKLSSSSTAAENNTGGGVTDPQWGYVAATNSTGFNVTVGSGTGDQVNRSSYKYVAWCWKAGGTTVSNTSGSITSQVRANQQAGFSIVSYTGNGTVGATVGHGLGTTPGMVIVKSRNSAQNWPVKILPYMAGGQRLQLNTTDAILSESAGTGSLWNAVNPNSTVITLGDQVMTNANGTTYIAYCWTAVPGFSAFGSYVGNGSAEGPFVYTGFKPRFILIKRSSTAGSWHIYDTQRSPSNLTSLYLVPDQSNAEYSGDNQIDILSNGFKLRSTNTGSNENGTTIIYAAWAEHPTRLTTAR